MERGEKRRNEEKEGDREGERGTDVERKEEKEETGMNRKERM